MTDAPDDDAMALLRAAQAGDESAAARLLPLVYEELRKLPRTRMARRPPGDTLQPTALVHEAYLRLLGKADLRPEGRRHFFFAAARAMRDILVERARARAGPKRGGGRLRVELKDDAAVAEPPADGPARPERRPVRTGKGRPPEAQIVQLRYFAGMNAGEAAQVLGISERTLHRHWRFIKAWLRRRLDGSGG